MNVSISPTDVESLIMSAGNTELLKALRHQRYRSSLERLAAIGRCMPNYSEAASSPIKAAISQLRNLPPGVQRTVFEYPTFSIWLDAVESLARDSKSDRNERLYIQALHLGRFAVAGAIADVDGDFQCEVPVDVNGRIFLPSSHRFIQLASEYSTLCVNVTVASGRIDRITHGGDDLEWRIGEIPVCQTGCEINSLDEDFRQLLPEFIFANLDRPAVLSWKAGLDSALEVVSSRSVALADELKSVKVVVPVLPRQAMMDVSGSVPAVLGVTYLSWTGNTPQLIETLIHEYHHQKLGLLTDLDPLFTPGCEPEIYYSPWKTEPRPLLGIFHAAFVFQAVYQFWNEYFSNDTALPLIFELRTRRRAYFVSEQVRIAIQVLRTHAVFTPIGKATFAGLARAFDQSPSLLSGCSEPRRQAMTAILAEHMRVWEVKYGGRFKAIPSLDPQD